MPMLSPRDRAPQAVPFPDAFAPPRACAAQAGHGAARRLLRGLVVGLGIAALTGCAQPVTTRTAPEPALDLPPLPPMKRFATAHPVAPQRPNAEMARDFLDLSFWMESGRELPVLTRYEKPVALYLAGEIPPSAPADAALLVQRLRREAGIDIRLADGAAPARGIPAATREGEVTVEFLSRARMQRLVPEAACFVVPRVGSWEEYRRARRTDEIDWATLRERSRATVFIPADTAPQEIRDCLHEEVAQALGPLNDLYRLPDSIFNDDNFQSVLTGFDMLMLRTYYAPQLHSGMGYDEVAAKLPAILPKLNPRGGAVKRIGPEDPTPRAWIDAMETALGPRGSDRARQRAAREAVEISERMQWKGARAGFSFFALGRLSLSGDLELAFASFLRSALIYHANPDTELHSAFVDMQLAAFALAAGQPEDVLIFTDRAIPVVRRAENASLLSTLELVRAEALDLLGRRAEARTARLDATGWARYGFGADDEVRARLADIAALTPPAEGAASVGTSRALNRTIAVSAAR